MEVIKCPVLPPLYNLSLAGKVRPPPNPVKSQPDISKLAKRPRDDHTKGITLHEEDELAGSLTVSKYARNLPSYV